MSALSKELLKSQVSQEGKFNHQILSESEM
jgi:hypothetical protein